MSKKLGIGCSSGGPDFGYDYYNAFLSWSGYKHDYHVFKDIFIPHLLCELVRFYKEPWMKAEME